jgi:hypothetical protein
MARELSGTLSRNEKREEGTNQPEYRGKALINGIEFRISAWVREYEGRKFFSLAFSPPKEDQARPGQQASPELKAQQAKQAGYGNARRMSDVGVDHRRGFDDGEIPF